MRVSAFPASLKISALTSADGLRIDGTAAGDMSGGWVSSAGDVNGDGIDDFVIGAKGAGNNGRSTGSTYVVFGKLGGFTSVNLSHLDGTDGFRLDGAAKSESSGQAVSSAGDVNGDGIDDLIIGSKASPGGEHIAGSSYVVFGQAQFSTTFDLATLDGSNGFRVDGAAPGDRSGYAVSAAGDINDDGYADVVVGAPYAARDGKTESGASYVLFGHAGGFDPALNLAALDAKDGFRIDGLHAGDRLGFAVSSAGDINQDGIDDVLLSAPLAEAKGTKTGESYILFGKTSDFGRSVDLSKLDGTNGFRIVGAEVASRTGWSAGPAGDVNGDGIDDVIIAGVDADPTVQREGSSFVVFGRSTGFDATLDLENLDGTNGFRIDGIEHKSQNTSVRSAGDFNGDGFGDLIIGSPYKTPKDNINPESAYVVFGQAGGFPAHFDVSVLDGSNGFRLKGETSSDDFGRIVASAGDVNGDDFDDLIVSAPFADHHGRIDSGSTYIIYGRATGPVGLLANPPITGNGGDNTLTGGAGDDVLIGKAGADRLDGAGGHDTASYETAISGVSASLADPSANTGDAQGDTYHSIDSLRGTRFDDVLVGNGGDNILEGLSGDDVFVGGAGADAFLGGAGRDTVSYEDAGGGVIAFVRPGQTEGNTGDAAGDNFRSIEVLVGSQFKDRLSGDGGHNWLYGLAGNDLLNGQGGNDRLFGGGGNDRLYGGSGDNGRDILTGGDGADTFVFAEVDDGPVGSQRDVIADFVQGADHIDLSAIDPANASGQFTFLEGSGTAFTGHTGELRYDENGSGNATLIEGDVNGDGVADFQIKLAGMYTLTGGDFLL